MIRAVVAVFLVLALLALPARALEPVVIGGSDPVHDLLPSAELYLNSGGRLQVSTAPDLEGVVQRIEVQATQDGTRHWAAIGLQNPGDEQIDRLLVAPHHRLPNSGIFAPDLGSERIAAVTPSEGFPPQRLSAPDADVFRLTLDPGATVTYALELTSARLPTLQLWEPAAYRESQNAYTLYKGIVVGIAGLLALFMLAVFVIKGSLMFASAAVLAWAAFFYVLIDFAFLSDVLATRIRNDALLRAVAEALLPLSLAAFLFSYLNVARWRLRNASALVVLVPVGALCIWIATINPVLTASLSRILLGGVVGFGLLALLWGAARGNDRAIMLLPTWALLIAWATGLALTARGDIDNAFVQPALNGGLVLLVLLIGFTVMQHAFAGASLAPSLAKEVERDVLALAGSGDIVWDWNVADDHITCGAEAERLLGLEPGDLQGPPQTFFNVLHPQDRDRFRATLNTLVERRRGRINDLFRFRGVDGHFRWLRLCARPVIGTTGEIIRCVGTVQDETEAKTIEERLLHDSVFDNLTGLPNRTLFLDRVEMARAWSNETTAKMLFIFVVNPDNFAEINDKYGQSTGDSVLLSLARRLGRILKRHDSLARLSGDAFALLVYSDPAQLAALASRIQQALAVPIQFADDEIVVRVSIGIAGMDLEADSAAVIVDNAELALRRAKRQEHGVEVFDPLMRRLNMSGRSLSRDLKRAIDEDKVKLQFRPIVELGKGRTIGYEAMPSWHHPLQGPLAWPELLRLAGTEGLAAPLALSTMERCAEALTASREKKPVAMLLTLPTLEVFSSELVGDVKTLIARNRLDPNTLWLGVPEDVLTDNPEFGVQLLARLRDVGAGTFVVDFGRRQSMLALLPRLGVLGIRVHDTLTAGGPDRDGLLKGVFQMVSASGAAVMVGGVADEAAAKRLHGLGARYGVGPTFGRPIKADMAKGRATIAEAAE